MKKIEMILSGLLLLTLANITVGSGKLDLYQKHFINDDEFNSLTLLMDANDENILNGIPDYQVEKSDSLEPWLQIPLTLVADLKSVFFIDENVGFIVGFKTDDWYSIILKTTDGGISWTRYNLTTRVIINSIALIDSNTLIAVGGGWNGVAFELLILKTTDQGNSWTRIYIPNIPNYINYFASVAFRPNGTGVIVGDINIVYITTNSGTTWTLKNMGTHWSQALTDVCFLDSVHIIAIGTLGNIILSSDLGNSWESVNSSIIKDLFAVEYVNGNLYITGESGLVIFSSDTGNIWQSQTRVTTAHLLGIHFTSSTDGYIVGGRSDAPGGNNAILKTTDAGVTWQKQSHNSNFIMNDVFFVNDSIGWIVGNSGLILKTTNAGVTFIEDEENNPTLPEQYLLQQNYPNPFNPSTSIRYAVSSTQFVTLKVYDLLGREVVTLVNEEKPAGSYNAQFTMNNVQLSSGIYFYKLQAGDFVETKKMILLK